MGARVWYELRVREQLGPDTWVKKSKFYFVKGPSEAVEQYEKRSKTEHNIMWCEKDRRHSPDRLQAEASRIMGDLRREGSLLERTEAKRSRLGVFGEFLSLGDEFLHDLSQREKVIVRRSNEQREKGTTGQTG